MNTLASAAPPPTPPFDTSLYMPLCAFLIVWGSRSISINSHSLWWSMISASPLVAWRLRHCVLLGSGAQLRRPRLNRLKTWKAASAVGQVWLYTLTAGDCWLLKLHTWMWKSSDVLQQRRKPSESCLSRNNTGPCNNKQTWPHFLVKWLMLSFVSNMHPTRLFRK